MNKSKSLSNTKINYRNYKWIQNWLEEKRERNKMVEYNLQDAFLAQRRSNKNKYLKENARLERFVNSGREELCKEQELSISIYKQHTKNERNKMKKQNRSVVIEKTTEVREVSNKEKTLTKLFEVRVKEEQLIDKLLLMLEQMGEENAVWFRELASTFRKDTQELLLGLD